MGKSTRSVMDLIRWARGARDQQIAQKPERPIAEDTNLTVDVGVPHTLCVSEFPVEIPGGRVLEHLRIRVVSDACQVRVAGVDAGPDQQITVGDFYAGSVTIIATGSSLAWIEYDAYDGQCYSECARMSLAAFGTQSTRESASLESLMVSELDAGRSDGIEPTATEVRGEDAPGAEEPAPTSKIKSRPRKAIGKATPRDWPKTSRRLSKSSGVESHRLRQREKTQSRRSAMRRRRGADPE